MDLLPVRSTSLSYSIPTHTSTRWAPQPCRREEVAPVTRSKTTGGLGKQASLGRNRRDDVSATQDDTSNEQGIEPDQPHITVAEANAACSSDTPVVEAHRSNQRRQLFKNNRIPQPVIAKVRDEVQKELGMITTTNADEDKQTPADVETQSPEKKPKYDGRPGPAETTTRGTQQQTKKIPGQQAPKKPKYDGRPGPAETTTRGTQQQAKKIPGQQAPKITKSTICS
ncbi:hypothetical protein QE152_g38090 [Popillia japonica]|uniref:Uncharacterized protein n=1 Tax=Popillia japonica TaxID=7064 RepID=A0AAW1I849_POPJA